MNPIAARTPAEHKFKEVLYEKKGHVARVTINRPHNYNAYSTPALDELRTAFRDASFDDSIGVIVFTGAGDRAFCTGGDVKEYEEQYTSRPQDYWKYMNLFAAYIESIVNCGKPVVARLNGMAVGGGNESHIACDLSVIAEHAYIAQVGTNVGSVACGGSTQWLPIIVGDRRAREILMLNEQISPYKALDWGLVNEVAPSVVKDGQFIEKATPEQLRKAKKGEDGYSIDLAKLDEAVDNLCTRLLAKFPECTRYTKEQVNYFKHSAWYATVGHARDWLSTHYGCYEPIEGMRAFVEKRKIDYGEVRERWAEGRGTHVWGAYKKECKACGAKGLPADFSHCGLCGEKV